MWDILFMEQREIKLANHYLSWRTLIYAYKLTLYAWDTTLYKMHMNTNTLMCNMCYRNVIYVFSKKNTYELQHYILNVECSEIFQAFMNR